MNADLHCHSIFSDGTLTPEVLAARASAHGVTLWSLTDHDILDGQVRARQAAYDLKLDYCCGVEISVTWAQQTIHILGLNIDPLSSVLLEGLASLRSGRVVRAQKIGTALEKLGITGSYQGALRYAYHPDLISRTHFARYLLDAGVCQTISEVFKRYLGEGCPAYIAHRWTELSQAIEWIQAAGGVAVIAHPGRYSLSYLQQQMLFESFKNFGGVGIEVVTGNHTPDQCNEYAKIAMEYDFFASRGSDFHGVEGRYTDLGDLPELPKGIRPIWECWS